MKILSYPDIWIGDSGATSHMALHKGGMVNVRPPTLTDDVRVRN